MAITIVTGYVPIKGHPRTPKEYGALGADLFGNIDCITGDCVIMPFYETVQETWLWKLIQASHKNVSHSAGDNPKKNSLAYHCVQHQKFAWLLKAALRGPPADTYVWLDYGLGALGASPAAVNAFISAIKPDDFAIPGCWPKDGLVVSDFFPCWRFCGSMFIVPKKDVFPLYKAVKQTVKKHIQETGNVEWEVNSVARAEQDGLISPRWYEADHNKSMLTHYIKDLPCAN
jgi:hypothetical protein